MGNPFCNTTTGRWTALSATRRCLPKTVSTRARAVTTSIPSTGKQAWAGAFGVFPGAKETGGLLIFPHAENPHHPPDWVEYPDLNWIQPTFPAAGVRYELKPGKPLTLRYRLWVWNGEEPPQDVWQAHWNAYHLAVTGGET
ncbi:MAG: PmoA family protein [Firmicutes bacterium]|nr:PmoA family protein [Bacillota bacterium]